MSRIHLTREPRFIDRNPKGAYGCSSLLEEHLASPHLLTSGDRIWRKPQTPIFPSFNTFGPMTAKCFESFPTNLVFPFIAVHFHCPPSPRFPDHIGSGSLNPERRPHPTPPPISHSFPNSWKLATVTPGIPGSIISKILYDLSNFSSWSFFLLAPVGTWLSLRMISSVALFCDDLLLFHRPLGLLLPEQPSSWLHGSPISFHILRLSVPACCSTLLWPFLHMLLSKICSLTSNCNSPKSLFCASLSEHHLLSLCPLHLVSSSWNPLVSLEPSMPWSSHLSLMLLLPSSPSFSSAVEPYFDSLMWASNPLVMSLGFTLRCSMPAITWSNKAVDEKPQIMTKLNILFTATH